MIANFKIIFERFANIRVQNGRLYTSYSGMEESESTMGSFISWIISIRLGYISIQSDICSSAKYCQLDFHVGSWLEEVCFRILRSSSLRCIWSTKVGLNFPKLKVSRYCPNLFISLLIL